MVLLLAVLVALGAAATAADAVAQNTAGVHAVLFGQSLGTWGAGKVFVAGAVLGVVFLLAVWVMGRAWAWRRRRRRAAKVELAEARARHDRLTAENARLQQALGTGEADPYPAGSRPVQAQAPGREVPRG